MTHANRRRVCFISSPGHRDYVLTFGRMLAKQADLLLIVEDTVSEDDAAAVGARKAVRLPWPRHRDVLGNVRHLAKIKAEIDTFNPDVVHVVAEGQVWFTALKTILGARPLVVTLHDVHTHPGDRDSQTIPRPIINAFVRSADAVIVHGEGLKSDAQASLGLRPDRVFSSIHPVSRRYREIADEAGLTRADDGALRVLFFGRIFKYKGLEHLVAADALIGDTVRRRKMVIAGRGDMAVAQAAAKEHPEHFDLRPRRIDDLETAQLFADADLLVLPYIEASQSGVLAIAPSFGLPVVASDIGEIGDMVRTTGMGLLVPPADPAALARALREVLEDDNLRAGLAGKSAAAATGALSPERIWTLTEAAYDGAVRHTRRGGRPLAVGANAGLTPTTI